MKKKIFLVLILLLELAFFVIHGMYDKLGLPEIFNYVNVGYDLLMSKVVAPLVGLLHLGNIPYNDIIVILLINVVFILVYYLIFGTIGAIAMSSKKRKVRRVIKTPYQLTPTEEEKFSYQRYMKKFPKVRFWSLIIPLAALAVIFLARFDSDFSAAIGAEFRTDLMIYSDYIQPVIIKLFGSDEFLLVVFSNPLNIGYMDIVCYIPSDLYYLEFVLMGVITLVVILIWCGILSLLYLPFKKACAKNRARKARNKYVFKKDYKEYKLRTKHKKNYSSKSEEFMTMIEKEEQEQQALAKELSAKKNEKVDSKPAEYYDDLGHGVREVGVGALYKEKKDKALIEREVRYITESDFDIELEEEPVIEVVEEDSIDQIRQQAKEDELIYEKYQPDDLLIKPVEAYQPDLSVVNDYVAKIGDVNNTEVKNEDLVEPREFFEEVKEETPVVEEPAPVEEQPAIEEVPEVKEEPKVEEVPVVEAPQETPVIEEQIQEETAIVEEPAPVDEVLPVDEVVEEPVVEEVAPVEEAPIIEEIPEVKEEVVEETPVVEEEVVEEQIQEEVAIEEPTQIEEPVSEEVQEEVVEEQPAVQEISLENLSPLERYRLQKKQERERLEKERQALIESGNLTEENDPLKKYRVAKANRSEARVPTLKEQEILKQASIIQQKQNRSRKR